MSTNWIETVADIESRNDNSPKFCDLVTLPVDQVELEDARSLLRDAQRDNPDYENLKADIAANGLMEPITVRRRKSNGKFVILNGVQRFSCHKDLGLPTIKAMYYPNIDETNPGKILMWQVAANVHRLDTKKGDLARQFLRILTINEGMTQAELADMANVTQAYVSNIMSLNGLSDKHLALVNDGTLSLQNAINLAKLPEDERPHFLDRAKSMGTIDFAVAVKQRKIMLDNERKGLPKTQWTPVFIMRTAAQVKEDISELNTVNTIDFTPENINELKDDPKFIAGRYYQALRVGHLDPESIAIQTADHERAVAERESKKNARKAEREAEKAKKGELSGTNILPVAVAS